MTVDDKLNEIERLLIDTIHKKVVSEESLSSYEMQLVLKWLKPKSTPKAPNSPCEPIVTQGQPLPFLKVQLPFEDEIQALEEVM